MKTTVLTVATIVILALVCRGAFAGAGQASSEPIESIPPAWPVATPLAQMCVTEGTIQTLADGSLRIEDTKVRAVLKRVGQQAVSLRFRYLGETSQLSLLRSGEPRQQLGIKLRAADGCNVLYAMWRIQPTSRLVVQVKQNPGKTTSANCGNQGYKTVKPSFVAPVPILTPDSQHVLSARLQSGRLVVWADHLVVWQGQIDDDLPILTGPVGLRTDNVRLDFNLFSDPGGNAYSCSNSH